MSRFTGRHVGTSSFQHAFWTLEFQASLAACLRQVLREDLAHRRSEQHLCHDMAQSSSLPPAGGSALSENMLGNAPSSVVTVPSAPSQCAMIEHVSDGRNTSAEQPETISGKRRWSPWAMAPRTLTSEVEIEHPVSQDMD